ncbi:MAG: hypothetical protein ACK5KU_08360 [Beutenbergiaceae bacterium]
MSVSLDIPGDPSALYATADWLDKVGGALVELNLELAYLASDGQRYMNGEAGSAFRNAATTIRGDSEAVLPYCREAADALSAYAHRLERGERDFASYADQCRDKGLTVYGKTVLRPTSTAMVCAEPGVDAEWDAHMSRVRTYQDLCERVGTWWGELEVWIAEHLDPFVARVDEFTALNNTYMELRVGNEDLVASALTYAEERSRRDLAEFREVAQRMQDEAQAAKRGLRSGNPAVRAAAEAADLRSIHVNRNELLDHIRQVSRVTKFIPVAGTALEVVTAAGDIAGGESGSSVIVEAGGGMAGGAAVGGIIAAAGGPVGWVVGGVIVGGVVIGAGSRWAWESWVPLDVREAIDGWLYDGTSGWQGPQLAD